MRVWIYSLLLSRKKCREAISDMICQFPVESLLYFLKPPEKRVTSNRGIVFRGIAACVFSRTYE